MTVDWTLAYEDKTYMGPLMISSKPLDATRFNINCSRP